MTERLTPEAGSTRTVSAAGADAGEECLHALAQRMARACRHVVQGCLREEEWLDADEAFFEIILAGLRELHSQVS
jgi:hypothetical protein